MASWFAGQSIGLPGDEGSSRGRVGRRGGRRSRKAPLRFVEALEPRIALTAADGAGGVLFSTAAAPFWAQAARGPAGIVKVMAPRQGTYAVGAPLTFSVQFNRSVVVEGAPLLPVRIGETVRDLSYVGGSGTRRLRFSTTILPGEIDRNGVQIVGALGLPEGASIRDTGGSAARVRLPATPKEARSVLVDGVAPQVTQIAPPTAVGRRVDVRVRFDEPVVARGRSALALLVNGQVREAPLSKVRNRVATFSYRLAGGESVADVKSLGQILVPSGGFLRDRAGNAANVVFELPSLEVISVDQIPESGLIKLTFNQFLDPSYSPSENFQQVIVNGEEKNIIASAIAGSTLTLSVSPFEEGVVQIAYFDKTPGVDDSETLQGLGGSDISSFYLVSAKGYTQGFEFFVDHDGDGKIESTERTQWEILDDVGLNIVGPGIGKPAPESALLPGQSLQWLGSPVLTSVGSATSLSVATRIEDNPNFSQADAMLAAKFAKLAYEHRKPEFASMIDVTGWTGITLTETERPALASGTSFSTVAGYGVDDPLTMQSYALAARTTLWDGTEQFIVSFEGSNSPIEEPADWIVNASKYGWSRYYASLMPIVTQVIREMLVEQDLGNAVELILTGHSLGGAAAMVAYADLFVSPGQNLWPATTSVLAAGSRIYDQPALNEWEDSRIRALLDATSVYTIGAPSFLIEPTKPDAVDAVALLIGSATAYPFSPLVSAGIVVANIVKALTVDDSKLPDLTGYSDAVFQYAHENTSWYLPGDIVAQLGSRQAGTQLDINLTNDYSGSNIHYRYTGPVLYAIPGGTHGSGNYVESVIRSTTGDPLLKSRNDLQATSPMLAETKANEGSGRNDRFVNRNAVGAGGNDVFWYSDAGTSGRAYTADGGAGDDLYVIKDYGISLTIDGSLQSGHDTLLISLNGSTLESTYFDTDSNGEEDQAVFRIVSPEGQRSSTVTVNHWNNFKFAAIARVEKTDDPKWDVTYC